MWLRARQIKEISAILGRTWHNQWRNKKCIYKISARVQLTNPRIPVRVATEWHWSVIFGEPDYIVRLSWLVESQRMAAVPLSIWLHSIWDSPNYPMLGLALNSWVDEKVRKKPDVVGNPVPAAVAESAEEARCLPLRKSISFLGEVRCGEVRIK